MVRLTERMACEMGYKAMVTGDSLGQVASQTIENLTQVSNVLNIPIFQPLITYDKQEIIDLAKVIGTYDLSIENYKDCCSIVSRNPRTKSRSKEVLELELRLNMSELIDKSLDLVTEMSV